MRHILLILFIVLMLCIARLVWLHANPAPEVRVFVPMKTDESMKFDSPIKSVQDIWCETNECKG